MVPYVVKREVCKSKQFAIKFLTSCFSVECKKQAVCNRIFQILGARNHDFGCFLEVEIEIFRYFGGLETDFEDFVDFCDSGGAREAKRAPPK